MVEVLLLDDVLVEVVVVVVDVLVEVVVVEVRSLPDWLYPILIPTAPTFLKRAFWESLSSFSFCKKRLVVDCVPPLKSSSWCICCPSVSVLAIP